MKDPDVLYNMLKNLLAQIKVSVSAEHGSAGEAEVKKTAFPLRVILMPGPSWNL